MLVRARLGSIISRRKEADTTEPNKPNPSSEERELPLRENLDRTSVVGSFFGRMARRGVSGSRIVIRRSTIRMQMATLILPSSGTSPSTPQIGLAALMLTRKTMKPPMGFRISRKPSEYQQRAQLQKGRTHNANAMDRDIRLCSSVLQNVCIKPEPAIDAKKFSKILRSDRKG